MQVDAFSDGDPADTIPDNVRPGQYRRKAQQSGKAKALSTSRTKDTMRPTKNRSRSNKNRNRSVGNNGNIVNRVFDSSGPEGKVRGTPQQIIEKYNQLARDAQLSGDRVALENFQQHAEHYMRMLGEAQREQDARREQQEQQNRERQAERDRERAERQEREANDGRGANANKESGRSSGHASEQRAGNDPAKSPQPDVIERDEPGENSGLVETPESAKEEAEVKKPKPRAPRKPRKPRKVETDTESADAAE